MADNYNEFLAFWATLLDEYHERFGADLHFGEAKDLFASFKEKVGAPMPKLPEEPYRYSDTNRNVIDD